MKKYINEVECRLKNCPDIPGHMSKVTLWINEERMVIQKLEKF